MTMLDAVYVDPREEKSIVAIRPKPAFRSLFEVALTCEGSDVLLIKEEPPVPSPEAPEGSCFWWRRGRVELSLKQQLVVWVIPSWDVGNSLMMAGSASHHLVDRLG